MLIKKFHMVEEQNYKDILYFRCWKKIHYSQTLQICTLILLQCRDPDLPPPPKKIVCSMKMWLEIFRFCKLSEIHVGMLSTLHLRIMICVYIEERERERIFLAKEWLLHIRIAALYFNCWLLLLYKINCKCYIFLYARLACTLYVQLDQSH